MLIWLYPKKAHLFKYNYIYIIYSNKDSRRGDHGQHNRECLGDGKHSGAVQVILNCKDNDCPNVLKNQNTNGDLTSFGLCLILVLPKISPCPYEENQQLSDHSIPQYSTIFPTLNAGWYSQHASTINPSHIDQLLSTALSSWRHGTALAVNCTSPRSWLKTCRSTRLYIPVPSGLALMAVKIPGIKCCKMLQDAGIMDPAKGLSSTGRPLIPSAAKARKWNATQQGNCSSPETQILRPTRVKFCQMARMQPTSL